MALVKLHRVDNRFNFEVDGGEGTANF